MSLVTFVIPVRHQDNAKNWNDVKSNLVETIRSISHQSHAHWRGVVVANEGAELPDMPARFSAVRVSFPPNRLYERGTASREEFYDAVRADKGRRVLSGMLSARDSRFFMVVDDDDFVSSRIVEHVSKHRTANGWKVTRGYVWDHGGRVVLGHDRFNDVCGTSLVVRSDLYGLPEKFEDASEEWIKSMLGSHRRIADILAARGTPLEPLPFRGAVYRVSHRYSHSQTPSLVRRFFLNREFLFRPHRLMQNLASLRLVDPALRREFFGQ